MKKFFFIICLLIVILMNTHAQEIELSNWWMSEAEKNEWLPTQVPGSVHSDLLALNKIPHPFKDTNETSLQWIAERDWIYRNTFTCSPEFLKNKRIEISFAGLKTWAEVKLNNVSILIANNAFRTYTVNVKNLLRAHNTITITFKSSINQARKAAKKLNYTLPGNESVFIRQPAYEFGWDWAPRYVNMGISGKIKVQAWSDFNLRKVSARTLFVRNDTAYMEFTAKIASDTTRSIQLRISEDFRFSARPTEIFTLFKGENTLTYTFQVVKPELWWCNGMGTPHLYNYYYMFQSNNSSTIAGNFRFGIRTIELVQEKDSLGSSFYFKLNNKPVFIKGADYIPPSSFLSTVRWKQLDSLILKVSEAHMNMIRVWGGGTYGNDWLYEICDRNGIMIWQDFPFACAMYPGDKDFLLNVQDEALENIERVKGHPSLALWCGNNESDEGWQNWGWQKQYKYSKKDSTKIWNDYLTLFHSMLPSIVKKITPEISYIPTSPLYGWGRKQAYTSGDSHYWGVWWGMEPFENYRNKVPRFASEYGFQSLPNLSTFQSITQDSLYIKSAAIKAHQKHPRGYETIETYLARDYKPVQNLDDYIYLSQLVQRDGMRKAIAAHRSHIPYCMGTMFWQLNDCWPVTSWSAYDHFGRKKAIAYALKQLYAPILLDGFIRNDTTYINLVNDSINPAEVTFKFTLMTFDGDSLTKGTTVTQIQPQKVRNYTFLPGTFRIKDSTNTYLSLKVFTGKQLLAKYNLFFQPPKKLALPTAQIHISPLGDGVYQLSTDMFAKDVYLFAENQDIYSDNFFDMEPNTIYTVKIPQLGGKKLQVKCLNNLYTH